jgi:uncharacterized membrane protein
MRDTAYRKRLAEDLPKWRQAGWVSEAGAKAILGALPAEGRAAFGMAATVGTLGALLIGLGIIAFVAANWDGMPRIYRFGTLIGALALAYLVAAFLRSRGLRIFSEAALLLAGLVFAAAIALIGQTYHLAGDFADAVMLWEAGMIAAALLAASPVLATLAVLGAGYWAWLGTIEAEIIPHWPSLVVILLGGIVATWLNSRMARIVAILAFGYWVALTILGFAFRYDWPFAGTLALLAVAAMAMFAAGVFRTTLTGFPRIAALGEDMVWPALAAILAALGIEQLAALWPDNLSGQVWVMPSFLLGVLAVIVTGIAYMRRGVTALEPAAIAVLAVGAVGFALWNPGETLEARLAGGALVIVAALWVTGYGQIAGHRGKSLGLFAFGAEVLYLYAVTIGTQFDTALAFIGGGVLFIVLAYVLFRIDRRMARRTTAMAETPVIVPAPSVVPAAPLPPPPTAVPTPPPPAVVPPTPTPPEAVPTRPPDATPATAVPAPEAPSTDSSPDRAPPTAPSGGTP